MIAALIRRSIANRYLVLLASGLLAAWGLWALLRTPLDALPDLSDVQVIIRTTYPGQAPQIVEDQVTYPLSTTMLSVPGARTAARDGGDSLESWCDRYRFITQLLWVVGFSLSRCGDVGNTGRAFSVKSWAKREWEITDGSLSRIIAPCGPDPVS